MLTMYDAVNVTAIPTNAQAVAGYVNGRWQTFPQLEQRWPAAHRLSIAVTAEADADCLDIESHDATNAQAAEWFRRQKARGLEKPKFYTSLSNVKKLVGVLTAAGISRNEYGLWSAHYTHKPHLCGPGCGYGMPTIADATQWTDQALGRSLDASLVADGFFVDQAARRSVLRAWILARRAQGWTWARLKATANWREWRRRGGK